MKRVLVVLGPTVTGKTDLALELAQKFDGELIACDSRQVYKGLDIGTGKKSGRSENQKTQKSDGWWEIDGVKIWLYDLVGLEKQFNAFEWAKKAEEVIEEIQSRGRLPIIVGGTGLYLKVLLEGLDWLPGDDPKQRVELEKLSIKELQNRVETDSPARWGTLNNSDKNNPRRLTRILEQVSMYPYSNKFKISNLKFKIPNLLKIGLTAPRPYLNSRIDQRVFVWFDQGILLEVKNLIDRGVPKSRFKELGLEYGLIADCLDGKISTLEELIRLVQTKTRQYAKRQMTWFKRDKEIKWFDISQSDLSHRVESEVRNWYNQES